MNRIFAQIGIASVRFRYLIVVVWIGITIGAIQLLPTLASVARDTTIGFLPTTVPSMQAAAMAAPFQDATLASATLIAARDGGLTTADNDALDSIEEQIRGIATVREVIDLGISRDGEARQALIKAEMPQLSGVSAASRALVASVREVAASGAPAGLQTHMTGEIAARVDSAQSSGTSNDLTQNISLLFIVVLLLLAFRAIVAPIVTLLPAVFVLLVAGPVIAQLSGAGLQVSGITESMLVVLILGAGTDYGVFLVFRVREELRRGLSGPEAVSLAVTRVGESIAFSALTVIAALVAVGAAEFGLYQSMGPALAVGVALMLVAALTLLPALLAILGRAVFWPSRVEPQPVERAGLWDRVGRFAAHRPGLTLGLGLLLFGGLAATSLTTGTAGFTDNTASVSGTDSAAGTALANAHFPSTTTSRTAILLGFDQPIWEDLAALETAQRALGALPEFSNLVGPLNPNGIPLTVDQLTQLHATLGPARDLPPVQSGTSAAPELYNAYRATGQLISPDGRTIQFSAETGGGDDTSPAALNAVPGMRADVARVATTAGASSSGVLGNITFSYDVSHLSDSDLIRVIPLVTVIIAILLAMVLRSLVAPVYLVASVVLSYLATLGLAGIVFVHFGGASGLTFVLPFLLFVFLMALGSDYNILVMSRIREEAHDVPLPEAVARAIGRTGATVTTAGVILGGTFAILAIVMGGVSRGEQIQQIGWGIAAGILMDTFLVRSLLVPSIVVLLGRWNWWPSKLSRSESTDLASSEAPGIEEAMT